MRIPLKVEMVADGLKPFAYVILRARRYHMFKPLRLFVDTGSPWTIIGERDASLLNVPYKRLLKTRAMTGIGGGSIIAHEMKTVEMIFKDENEKGVIIKFPTVYAIRTQKRDARSKTRSEAVPSILGLDFLLKNGFKLVFDPSNKTAYLEKKDVKE